MQNQVFSPRSMGRMAMCVALISVGGYIAFPTPFSPVMVTATTLALGITALVLPPKQTAVAILVWILLGAAGVPVFSGGQGGIGKLLGPSGGFFPGFLAGYTCVSYLKGSRESFGEPFVNYLAENNIGWVACWYDNSWEPPMFSDENNSLTEWGKFLKEYAFTR